MIAAGDSNVWICHVGDSINYGSFDDFTEIILSSRVDVTHVESVDSLVRCLDQNRCLSSGQILKTIECLSAVGPCHVEQHKESSFLGR